VTTSGADTLGAAFQAQSELFERFISMAKSPDEPEVIKMMLHKTIDISIALTGQTMAVSFCSTVTAAWPTVSYPAATSLRN